MRQRNWSVGNTLADTRPGHVYLEERVEEKEKEMGGLGLGRFRSNASNLGLPCLDVARPKWMLLGRQPRIASIIFGILSTIFFWIVLPHLHSFSGASSSQPFTFLPFLRTTTHYHDKLIANGTLGFQKIFAIGLADRSDRRDSLELAADVTKLQLDWMDGISPAQMNQKTIPPTFKLQAVLPGVTGCWRSHMNVIRKIVREKITTALIVEDDADWDLRIVSQMQDFATGTKTLLAKGNQEPKPRRSRSPYGEGWDILWVGHCGGFHGGMSPNIPPFIIADDATMPPAIAMDDMLFGLSPYFKWNANATLDPPCAAHAGRDPEGKTCDQPRLLPSQRIIQERAKPVCTAAYAISLEGARKILARVGGLSLTDVFAPVDQGFGDVCSGALDLPGERTRCFTPSPPYFRGYKAKGMAVGDSDIRVTGKNGEKRTVGWSKGIMWSARLNANMVVSNAGFRPEEQYVRDGFILDQRVGEGEWRLKRDYEYRGFRQDVVVENWIW